MRILGTVFSIIIFGLTFSFANCEAGGYTIHTVATYKEQGDGKVFLIYKMNETGEIQARLNAIDRPEVMQTTVNSLQVVQGSGACALNRAWQIDPQYKPDDSYSSELPYRLQVKNCLTRLTEIPKAGYLLYEASAAKVILPASLPITSIAEALPKDLESKVLKDLLSRELYLLTFPAWGTNGTEDRKGRIAPTMIQSRKFRISTIGRGPAALKLIVISLMLKDSIKAYPSEFLPTQLKDNPDQLSEFPVIYFIHPKSQEPRFIGDGSACSYVQFQKDEEGASFARFRATNAFDLNSDGIVDILEINDSFSYSIDAVGNPTVIHYGQGC